MVVRSRVYRLLLGIPLALIGCSRGKTDAPPGARAGPPTGERPAAPSDDPEWRSDAIRVSVFREGYVGTGRPYVRLDQTLPEGVEGWTMIKFQLPADWATATATMDGRRVLIKVPGGEQLAIDAANHGPLGFSLLGDGQSDDTIRQEWRRHASIRP
jgi:hypothetical protein